MAVDMDMSPEDRQACEENARKRDEFEDKLALAWGEVARTGAGKFVLKDLSERCNFRNSCIRNSTAPNANAVLVQEGKRAVFNHIMFYVRHDNERRKQ
jgi:hypothetical protein